MLSKEEQDLRDRVLITMDKRGHTFNKAAKIMGMYETSLTRSLLYDLQWMKTKTYVKFKVYLEKYEDKPVIQSTITEEVIQHKEIIRERYDEKLLELSKEAFIKSYNRILNPLGYQVVVTIEPVK